MSPRVGLDLLTILHAATEIADAEGVEAITLATLAKKLKVRPPSLYNYIDGLPGLRTKLAIYGLEQLYNKLTLALVGRAGDDAVHALALCYVNFARSHPGLYEATLRAPDTSQPELQKISGDIVNLVVRVFNHFGLENDMAIHAVRGIRSILHGFSSLENIGGFGIPLDVDVSLKLLIDNFLSGIQIYKGKEGLV